MFFFIIQEQYYFFTAHMSMPPRTLFKYKAHHNQVNFHYQSKYSCYKINESDAKYSLVNTGSTGNSHIDRVASIL